MPTSEVLFYLPVCFLINIQFFKINTILGFIEGQEDCLVLNVFTHSTRQSELKPVMVWIHGGYFFQGSSDPSFYGPQRLMNEDVVSVEPICLAPFAARSFSPRYLSPSIIGWVPSVSSQWVTRPFQEILDFGTSEKLYNGSIRTSPDSEEILIRYSALALLIEHKNSPCI